MKTYELFMINLMKFQQEADVATKLLELHEKLQKCLLMLLEGPDSLSSSSWRNFFLRGPSWRSQAKTWVFFILMGCFKPLLFCSSSFTFFRFFALKQPFLSFKVFLLSGFAAVFQKLCSNFSFSWLSSWLFASFLLFFWRCCSVSSYSKSVSMCSLLTDSSSPYLGWGFA